MRRKVTSALFQQALLRWENAVLIALAILLTAFVPHPFAFWPVWGWGVLALVGVVSITLSSLGETEVQSAAIDGALYAEYNPQAIKTPSIRASFQQNLRYRRTIEQMIAREPDGTIRTHLNDLADKIKQWTAYMYQLACMLDDYQCDPMLCGKIAGKNPAAIQAEIARIRTGMARETSPAVIEESKNLITSKQKYLQTAEALTSKMEAGALQLEQSQDAMATIYTQLKLLDTRNMENVSALSIDQDIDEQVTRMGDLIDGLQKAYQEGKE